MAEIVEEKELDQIVVKNGDTATNKSKEDITVSEREKELLDMVFNLENEKQIFLEQFKTKFFQLRKELEDTKIENEKLQKKNFQLEQNLKQAVAAGIDTPKDLDDILVKAKTLLFEKTKECQQKEQHISTLKNQVDAIKEVLNVTKEMVTLKTIEMDHADGRIESMNLTIKAEREKSALLEKKLGISQKLYEDLRKEYDCQSKLGKELKEAYEQKVDVLTKTIEKLK